MAFFEDLGRKISETSQSAAQKTKNLAEVTKLNGQVSDLNKSITSFYVEIGKMYYDKTKEAPEEEFAGLFAQITEAEAKIEETKEQIRVIKGIAVCPNCNAEVPMGQKFCSNCGNQIRTEAQVAEEAGKKVCSVCGAEANADQKFCSKCGGQL
ncbi:MAG: zinc ribbon domain-containing protein [Lachnospiraceae bacterium]|nr:zinc ribbon domain-containing protein [Lachnospiraceae bacterium]